MIEPENKPQTAKDKKAINYTKWAFFLGTPITLISALAAVIVVPEIRCSIGWKASCPIQKQPISIIIQDESGTVIPGVRVQVISQGIPEVQTTDNNGLVQVQIPNKGIIVVNISKVGYPTQNITIDLENEQSTTRIVTLSKSGSVQVQQNLSSNVSSQKTSEPQQGEISPNISSIPSPVNLSSSAQPNKNASGVFPSQYVAEWKGTVNFTNQETKSTVQSDLNLSFTSGKIGSNVGKVFYSGNSSWSGYCQGSLILQGVKSNSVELFENITNGSSNCTKNNSVTVVFKGDDILEFKRTATGSQNIGSGLLTRQKQ
jgi:Carboxypeptidase regulatory-like domain